MKRLLGIRTPSRLVSSTMLLAMLAILTPFMAVPTPAHASATVCRAAGPEVQGVCFTVGGKNGWVVNISLSGLVTDWRTSICDYSGRVRISTPSGPGPVFEDASGPLGCSIGMADINIRIDQTFPIGSYVCAAFFVQGRQQAVEQCIKLTKTWW